MTLWLANTLSRFFRAKATAVPPEETHYGHTLVMRSTVGTPLWPWKP
jgi:hypothetical protein